MASPLSNDDIRDLIGRYATGSLTAEEHQRLFDAALDDQELFDELAREQDMKQLIDEPGARDRLIRALEPPKRKVSWIYALVPVAALSALLIVFWMRPAPKPAGGQVAAVTTAPAQREIATAGKPPADQPVEPPVSRAEPAGTPRLRDKALEPLPRALEKKTEDRESDERKKSDQKEEAQKEAAKDQIAATQPAAPPPPVKEKRAAEAKSSAETVQVQAMAPQVQRYDAQQQNAQNAPGGPRQQNAVQQPAARKAAMPVTGASARLLSLPPFGFHYSVETAGHLLIIPAGDGTLSVKSGDGSVLLPVQRVAAGTVNDIALTETVRSVTIVFSRSESPPQVTPAVRTATQGDEQGQNVVAIELKINP
jgi:hypothetical protein